MKKTLEIAERYARHDEKVKEWIKPKCAQGMECYDPCAWKAKKALERIV